MAKQDPVEVAQMRDDRNSYIGNGVWIVQLPLDQKYAQPVREEGEATQWQLWLREQLWDRPESQLYNLPGK